MKWEVVTWRFTEQKSSKVYDVLFYLTHNVLITETSNKVM